jgi:hypothetical protein
MDLWFRNDNQLRQQLQFLKLSASAKTLKVLSISRKREVEADRFSIRILGDEVVSFYNHFSSLTSSTLKFNHTGEILSLLMQIL